MNSIKFGSVQAKYIQVLHMGETHASHSFPETSAARVQPWIQAIQYRKILDCERYILYLIDRVVKHILQWWAFF